MEDQTTDESIEITDADGIETDLDAIARKGKGAGYVEQDNL